jgi:hypothetical protein
VGFGGLLVGAKWLYGGFRWVSRDFSSLRLPFFFSYMVALGVKNDVFVCRSRPCAGFRRDGAAPNELSLGDLHTKNIMRDGLEPEVLCY